MPALARKRRRRRSNALIGVAIVAGIATAFWFLVPDSQKKQLAEAAVRGMIETDRPDATTIESLQLSNFHLHLSNKDVAHFATLYRKYENGKDGGFNIDYYQKNNVWRKATMEVDGKPYRIKIRSHGSQPDDHRDGRYISLAIKLRDDEQIHNVNRFNLIIYPRIGPRIEKLNWYAQTFDLPIQIDRLISLRINDWEPSLYYMEHRLDNVHFETNGHPSWKQFGDHNKSMLHGEYDPEDDLQAEHDSLSPRLQTLLNEEGVAPLVQRGMLRKYAQLNDHIYDGHAAGVEKFFDLEDIASYEAARLLAGFRGHGTTANNAQFFFDTSAGKFEPVLHRDFYTDYLKERDTLLEYRWPNDPTIFPLSRLLCHNEPISQRKYQKIWNIVTSEQTLEAFKHRYVGIVLNHERLKTVYAINALKELVRGPLDDAKIAAVAKDAWWVPMVDNAAILKEHLSRCEPTVQAAVVDDQVILKVTPNSVGALTFSGMQLNFADRMPTPLQWRVLRVQEGETTPVADWTPASSKMAHLPHETFEQMTQRVWFCDGIDEALKPTDRFYYVAIRLYTDLAQQFDAGESTIQLKNIVTEAGMPLVGFSTLPDAERIASIFDNVTYPSNVHRTTAFLQQQQEIEFICDESGNLTIPAGTYHVTKTTVLPRDVDLTVEPGAEFVMSPDVSFVSYGNLDIAGTAAKPVIVRAVDPAKPFGVFACLGDETTHCNVTHLKLSGGNEDEVDGAYYSGGFALHYHDTVLMSDCEIAHNRADDGANIKHAKVHLKRCTFKGNFADQIDLDLCHGIVEYCTFLGATELADSNGDGLDVSVARIVASNNQFIGFPDKGISVGEQSELFAVNNRFENCRLGLAAKDESRCYLLNNYLTGCSEKVYAYKKKKIWGGSSVYLLSDEAVDTEQLVADELSIFHHVPIDEPIRFTDAVVTLDLLDQVMAFTATRAVEFETTVHGYVDPEE